MVICGFLWLKEIGKTIKSYIFGLKTEKLPLGTDAGGKEFEEEIFAVNFYKSVDDIKESIAFETELKTWANASAWSLEDGSAVEITRIDYDFDPDNIVPGVYDITFATEGYERSRAYSAS